MKKDLLEFYIKQKIKYATFLFSISLLLIIGILILNNRIISDDKKNQEMHLEYEQIERTFDRFITYKSNKSKYYSELTFTCLEFSSFGDSKKKTINNSTYLKFLNNYKYRYTFHNYTNTIPDSIEIKIEKLKKECDSFGFHLNNLDVPKDDSRELKFKIIDGIDSIFSDKNVIRILAEEINEVGSDFLFDQSITNNWILNNMYGMYLGGTSGNSDPVSYTNALDDKFWTYSYESIMWKVFEVGTMEVKEEFLTTLLYNYNEKLRDFKDSSKENDVNVIGVSIGIGTLLAISGFLIFVLYGLFFIYFQKERALTTKQYSRQRLHFPNFGILGAPFQKLKFKKNFQYWFTNTSWLFFLITPVIILFLGYNFRYNLVRTDDYGKRYQIFIYDLLLHKSSDTISLIGDLSHLFALIFMMWSIIEVTKIRPIKNHVSNIILIASLLSVFLFVLFEYIAILPSVDYFSILHSGLHFKGFILYYLYVFQFTIWILFLIRSIKVFSLIGATISAIFLLSNLYWM